MQLDDAQLKELLAGCERLADATERTVRVVTALAEGQTFGRRAADTILRDYIAHAESVSADLHRFRALMADIKSQVDGQ